MIKYLITLFLLFPIIGCSQKENKNPLPVTKTKKSEPVKMPAFDGNNAFLYLKHQTDFGPRTPGSPAHDKCLIFLESEMEKYAEAVNRQEFSHKGYDGKNIGMTNIISSFNLKATTRILLLAHWDSRPFCDEDPNPQNHNKPVLGANDGASGIAILMEIGRHLKEQSPAVGVDMLFTDGEDYGKRRDNQNYFLGARYFAKNISPGFKPAFGILLDMVGDAQLEIPKDQYSLRYAPEIMELIWSKARELGVDQFSDKLQGFVMDDHLPLNEVGIKTVDLIDFAYPDESNRYWHTIEDTPDKCSAESLEAVGRVLLNVIYTYPG
jgi:Peptidase family M28